MSSRVSNYADRRSNGNNNDDANPTSSRPRMTSGQHSSKAEHRESRSGPSPHPSGSFTSTAHKRSASGNPRPASRSDRRTERATITTREQLVSRAKSPERRSRDYGPSERWKTKEPSRHRATESKREIPLEAPPSRSIQVSVSYRPCSLIHVHVQKYGSLSPRYQSPRLRHWRAV